MSKFQIFTDSCSDLPGHLRKEFGLEYFRMKCVIDGEEKFADLDWKEFSVEEFYGWLKQGRHMKTTAVPYEEFVEKMTPYLEKGIDILYIACSHKLTGSMNVFELAKEELKEKFPDRKMIGIDSLIACASEGLVAIEAAKLQKEGKSLEEIVSWIEQNRTKYNFFCTVDDLTYIKNAGRIKGSKALLGNIFHKKPIFISDAKGNNYTLGTVTGTKNADKLLIEGAIQRIEREHPQRAVVVHSVCEDRALKVQKAIEDATGIKPEIWVMGPIIGTTCGPGTLATMFFGKEVTIFEGDGQPTPLDFSTIG